MTFRVICKRCGQLIHKGPSTPVIGADNPTIVSHGLCDKCQELTLLEEKLTPHSIKLGNRVQYTTSEGDEHPVSLGTVVYGTVVGRLRGTLNIHWDKLGITEYGIPEELLEKVERR